MNVEEQYIYTNIQSWKLITEAIKQILGVIHHRYYWSSTSSSVVERGAWGEVWDTAHQSCVCCRTVRPFAGCHGVGDRRIAVFTLKLVHKRTADHRHSPPAGPWANPTTHLCWKWLRNLLPEQGQAKFSNQPEKPSSFLKSSLNFHWVGKVI